MMNILLGRGAGADGPQRNILSILRKVPSGLGASMLA